MTLLTSNILQKVKDEFGLRTTWDLGVVRIKFRGTSFISIFSQDISPLFCEIVADYLFPVEDGGYELHRKVPYDYDSEYQVGNRHKQSDMT